MQYGQGTGIALDFTDHFSTHSGSLPPSLCLLLSFRYRRNRIRNELMPYLREHFNPRADEALARTAEVLQDEVALLEAQAGQLLSSCLRDSRTPTSEGSSSGDGGGSDVETAAGEGHHCAGVVMTATSGTSEAVQRRTATPSTNVDSASCTSSSRVTISVDREVMGAAPVALQRRAL